MPIAPLCRGLPFAALLAGLAACSPEPPGAPLHAAAASLGVPALPGSLGPNLVRGGDGGVVLSWIEPFGEAHALRYARWRNGAFRAPRTVSIGDDWFVNRADFPSVVPIDDGFWVAHWLVRRPAGGYAYDVYAAVSTDDGRTWSAGLRPHRDDTDSEHGFVSVFPDADAAGLVWLDGRRMVEGEPGAINGLTLRTARLSRSRALSAEQELDSLVCDCCQTDVAVSPDGPVAVYRNRTPEETRDIYLMRRVDGAWRPGRPVAADNWHMPACPVNGPVVAPNGDAVVVAWFTAADDRPRVRLARAARPGDPFSAPVDVVADDDTAGRVGLAVFDDGRAVVSSLRKMDDGYAELLLTPVARDGRIGAAAVLARGLPTFHVPQLLRDGDALLAVWTREDDDEQPGLAAARVPVASLDWPPAAQ